MILIKLFETPLFFFFALLGADLELSGEVYLLVSADFGRTRPVSSIKFHAFELIVDSVH